MTDSLTHILAVAKARNFSEDLTSALLADYHKGREAHEGKEGDWESEAFDFPENIMQEIAGALNYTIEGNRQGRLNSNKVSHVVTFLQWAAEDARHLRQRQAVEAEAE